MTARPATYRIAVMGAGNVATHLGSAFQKAGHSIVQVYSHTQAHAHELAARLGTTHTSSLKDLAEADLYLIALKDDVIHDIASEIRVKGIVAHTSGSIGMNALKGTSDRYGVIYPLQTFSKSRQLDLSIVPFCIEGSDQSTEETLAGIARSLGGNIHLLSSEQRAVLHLSAVFANNFSNHMYTVAADILDKKNIPFHILLPLIEETVAKIRERSPQEMQTGPAKRNDMEVIKRHIEMLSGDETVQALYKLISMSIAEKK
jgi:predicted short-subunit dehydrogenase-like oxidoreductase (DUF2520 family)